MEEPKPAYFYMSSGYSGMALAKHGTADEVCDVLGCDKPAERSFNIKQVSKSSLSLKSSDLRQVHLCKEHYKEFK